MPTKLIISNGNAQDVTDLQTAVNDNTWDEIHLQGTFNFTGLESGSPVRVITVARSVKICVEPGKTVTIIGGETPFLVAQTGVVVSFQGLEFRNSKGISIYISAAADISISDCTFQGVSAVYVKRVDLMVAAAIIAEGISGKLSVLNNRIDIGPGSNVPLDSTNGMNIFGPMASLKIIGNKISNVTAHGIDVRNATTPDVSITDNTIITGALTRAGSAGLFADALRCLGSGGYVVQNNTLDFGGTNGAGVRLDGTSDAKVRLNTIPMSSLASTLFGEESAGIQVRGSSQNNLIEGNEITGRARVALGTKGNPGTTKFWYNNHSGFQEGFVDVEIGTGASLTHVRPWLPPLEKNLDWGVSRPDATTAAKMSALATESDVMNPTFIAGTIADFGTDTTIEGNWDFVA